MKVLAYDIEGGKIADSAAAVKRAGQFDTIVAQKAMYYRYVNAMTAENPDLVLAQYINGTHTTNKPGSNTTVKDDWYVYDEFGVPVRAGGEWTNNYLMNPLSGWKAYKEQQAAQLLSESKYSALYVDELGTGCITNRAEGIGLAIDPRTDQPWTTKDWMDQMVILLEGYRTKLTQPVLANGLGNAVRFYDANFGPTQVLLSHSDGMVCEQFVRGPSQDLSIWPNEKRYAQELQMIHDAGEDFLGITKTWASGTVTVKQQWHDFALATFLLEANPGAHFYFTQQRATTTPTAFSTKWVNAKKLGNPTGPRVGYRRDYEHGYVTVDLAKHLGRVVVTA